MSMLIDAYRFGGGGGGGTDPNFSSVTSLLHFDGVDASTTFTDVKGKTWTAGGSAQLDTAQAKWGASSLLLGGSDYISTGGSTDYSPTGDFTYECWVRTTDVSSIHVIASTRGGGTGWQFQINAGGAVQITFFGSYSGGAAVAVSSSTLSTNTWYHVAWTHTGGTWRVFINGVLEGSNAPAGSYASNTSTLYLGFDPIFGGRYFTGHIDDSRITRGVARYTSTFTPPSAAFPDS